MDATLQKACDSFLSDLFAQLQTAQAAYYQPGGRYWQGLATPTPVPTKTARRAPDLTRKAGGHEAAWGDLGLTLPDTLPCAVEVHEYDGPDGAGWLLIGTVTESGVPWRRVLQSGPETWRAHDWTAVSAEA